MPYPVNGPPGLPSAIPIALPTFKDYKTNTEVPGERRRGPTVEIDNLVKAFLSNPNAPHEKQALLHHLPGLLAQVSVARQYVMHAELSRYFPGMLGPPPQAAAHSTADSIAGNLTAYNPYPDPYYTPYPVASPYTLNAPGSGQGNLLNSLGTGSWGNSGHGNLLGASVGGGWNSGGSGGGGMSSLLNSLPSGGGGGGSGAGMEAFGALLGGLFN